MRAESILETIGNTPHVRINKLYDKRVNVWVKLERANPGGSIKDRIGLSMVEDAEKRGILKEGSVIVEPTSGNTGVGLAVVAAVKVSKYLALSQSRNPRSASVLRSSLIFSTSSLFVMPIGPPHFRDIPSTLYILII